MADVFSNDKGDSAFQSGCRAESPLGKMWDEVRSLWSNEPKQEKQDCNSLNQTAHDAVGLNDKEKELLAQMYQALVRGSDGDLKTALSSNLFNESSAPRFVAALRDQLHSNPDLPQMKDANVWLDSSTGEVGLSFKMPVFTGFITHEEPLVLVASKSDSAAVVLLHDRPMDSLSYDLEHYMQNKDGRIYGDKFEAVDTSTALKEVANRLNHKPMGEVPSNI